MTNDGWEDGDAPRMTPLVVPVGDTGLFKTGPLTREEVEMAPQPASDYEVEHPPASPDDLRRLAGLPSSNETFCGAEGPNGETCRLAPHEDGLHAARGRTWLSVDPLAGLSDSEKTTLRLAVAVERGVDAIEKLTASIEHYVQQVLHTQKY